MISLDKRLKLPFVLLFSSSTIFFTKTASAEISANILETEKINHHRELELSASPEYTFYPISKLQYLAIFSDNLIQTTQVTELAKSNSQIPPCPPRNSEQPEFNKVRDLAKTDSEIKSCQTSSNSPEIDPLNPPADTATGVDKLQLNPNIVTSEQKYIIPPRVADEEKIQPRTTTIPLNGILINHLTKRQFGVGSSFGNNQNTSFDINTIVKLRGEVQENLTTNNIFTVDQSGEYLQLRTVRKSREINVNLTEPQTILGTELKLSITGSCILPGSNPDQICTYTPGLRSADINADTLTPNRISQTTTVGDVVELETLAAISQPGFQSGAVNGEEIGIDLFLPNTGSFVGNSTGDDLSINRREEINNTPVATYSRVRQIVKVNDREAIMGRTIRGFSFILNDDNTLLNTALQLGYNLLPDIVPNIASSENRVNSNVNNNLFLAANNARLPANSFTAYHGGIAKAESVPPQATNLSEVPAATFNGIWLGASPIVKRSSNIITSFQEISPLTVLSSGGGEGGFDSDVSFISLINNQEFSTANLDNYYSQVYVTIFNQEVNNVSSNRYREETEYVPHLSFTGNITGTRQALRYYTGVIGAESIKAYGGLDFTRNTANGWNFSGGVIGYVNPDVDYYSQVTGSVGKRFPLSGNNSLVLSTGVNYAFDRETRSNDFVNSITLRGRVNLGNVWFGVTNYFGDILPDAIQNTLVTSVGIQFSNNFSLSAYYNPINQNSARSLYGAGARLRLGTNQNSPTLNLSWRNNEYDYGRNNPNLELKTNENVFKVFLRGNF